MSDFNKQDHLAKRLFSYSAAAGLGAFSVGQQAEAAIIVMDFEPDEVLTNTSGNLETSYYDLSGFNEPTLRITVSATQLRIYGETGDEILTSGPGYYVESFDAGTLLGPSTQVVTGPSGLGARTSEGYNFIKTGKYVGFKWNIGDNVRYGYLEIDAVFPASGNLEVVVKSIAYESEFNTAIEAGAVPEPGSFALLAAGAGALAFRRKKSA